MTSHTTARIPANSGSDDAGNIWVAVSERREIKKITPDGTVTVILRVSAPFRPNGVMKYVGTIGDVRRFKIKGEKGWRLTAGSAFSNERDKPVLEKKAM